MDALNPAKLIILALIALLAGITGAFLICPFIAEPASRNVQVHLEHVQQMNAMLARRLRKLENSHGR